jgi:hypothetical protein
MFFLIGGKTIAPSLAYPKYHFGLSKVLLRVIQTSGLRGLNSFFSIFYWKIQKKFVPLQPHFGKSEAFDDVKGL